jgi:hypothetical protein
LVFQHNLENVLWVLDHQQILLWSNQNPKKSKHICQNSCIMILIFRNRVNLRYR